MSMATKFSVASHKTKNEGSEFAFMEPRGLPLLRNLWVTHCSAHMPVVLEVTELGGGEHL